MSETSGIQYAWRVHAALDSWTGKVDTKASITLAIEGATFGFVVSLSEKSRRFGHLHGAAERWYEIGVGCLLLAILLSVLVVMPQLRRIASRRNWQSNTIYFGHLRHWDADDLTAALKSTQLEEAQLARQLVTMSKIAWKKHSRLQLSLLFLIAGAGSLIIAALAS